MYSCAKGVVRAAEDTNRRRARYWRERPASRWASSARVALELSAGRASGRSPELEFAPRARPLARAGRSRPCRWLWLRLKSLDGDQRALGFPVAAGARAFEAHGEREQRRRAQAHVHAEQCAARARPLTPAAANDADADAGAVVGDGRCERTPQLAAAVGAHWPE